jgi:hypothetical protein
LHRSLEAWVYAGCIINKRINDNTVHKHLPVQILCNNRLYPLIKYAIAPIKLSS